MNLTSIIATLEESTELLKENQARLKAEMNSGMAASPGAGANEKHIKMAATLSKQSTELARETRQLVKQVKQDVAEMSVSDWKELTLQYIQNELAVGDRLDLYRKLQDAENGRTDRIVLTISELGAPATQPRSPTAKR